MQISSNGPSRQRRPRRSFSAEQKVAILKRHLVDGLPVSDLCDQHEILPTQFYQWQKQLFEGGARWCPAITGSKPGSARRFWPFMPSIRGKVIAG